MPLTVPPTRPPEKPAQEPARAADDASEDVADPRGGGQVVDVDDVDLQRPVDRAAAKPSGAAPVPATLRATPA